MTKTTWMIALAVLGGCGKKDKSEKHEEPAATGSAATTTTTAPAKEAPPPVDAAPAPPAPAAKHIKTDETGRAGYGCEFAGFRGTGPDKSAWFKIVMPEGKAAQAGSFQSWVFYYDAKGKQVKRYPHATSYDGAEKALGVSGPDVDKDKLEKTTVECEITSVKFKDHTYWMNDNLVPCCDDRPKGGVPEDKLKAQAGEQVAVEVLDAKAGKIKLTSLSDKPIKSVAVKVFHFHDDASYASADQNVDVALAPKASAEATVAWTGSDENVAEVKAAAANTLEAVAPSVYYDDGKRWSNGNLLNVPMP